MIIKCVECKNEISENDLNEAFANVGGAIIAVNTILMERIASAPCFHKNCILETKRGKIIRELLKEHPYQTGFFKTNTSWRDALESAVIHLLDDYLIMQRMSRIRNSVSLEDSFVTDHLPEKSPHKKITKKEMDKAMQALGRLVESDRYKKLATPDKIK